MCIFEGYTILEIPVYIYIAGFFAHLLHEKMQYQMGV